MNLYLSEDGRLRSGWRFAISAILVFIANYYLGGYFSFVMAAGHKLRMEAIYRPLTAILELAAFWFLTVFIDRPTVSVLEYNGLPRRRWLRESSHGGLLGLVLITLAALVIAAAFHLTVNITLSRRTISTALVVIAITLAGAMAEELCFRGYPFQRLVEGLGATGAILVLSALFGAVHLGNPHVSDNRFVQLFAFCNTLLIGIVLALAYLRTGALWFPFGLHFGWNLALGLIYGLPVSGITLFSVIVRSKVSGPEWFLGGSYGLEAGMLGTLVILLGLAYVLVFLKPVRSPIPETYVSASLPESI